MSIRIYRKVFEQLQRLPFQKSGLQPEAERRYLTVMFCDLVGSTALSDQLEPEELRHLVTEHQKVCQEVVARIEGAISQYLGEVVLVYWSQ